MATFTAAVFGCGTVGSCADGDDDAAAGVFAGVAETVGFEGVR